MSVPLSDTELAEIRERVPSPICRAAHPGEVDKDHVWVAGSLSGTNRCSACHLSQRALDSDEAVLLREVDRLRAELLEFTHPVATCFGCHHLAPWHVGELGKAERACTQRDCNCADLVKEG